MKYVPEYIMAHPVAEISNALAKAQVNPVIVRRIVQVYKENNFKLKASENPYKEENKTLNITESDARYLADYYKFCDEQQKREQAAYDKVYPYPGAFFDGVKVYFDAS